ncbi:hypothetical protein FRB99_006283 [Tulasnella sp. 403]|nr:hypothetical protein FRB99_006283 [Tulasnella sp. 403]
MAPPTEPGELPSYLRATSPPSVQVDPGTLAYFNQWCQQNARELNWTYEAVAAPKTTPLWKAIATVDGQVKGEGVSTGKKSAKVLAARAAMERMGLTLPL